MGSKQQRPGTAESGPATTTDVRDAFRPSPTPDAALGTPALSRRGFLGTAAVGVAALAIPGAAQALGAGPRSMLGTFRSPQPFGVQLYTVRSLMEKDVQGTLRQVAAIGYREVEFAGLFGKEPKTVAKWLAEDKLTSPSSHIPLDRLKGNLQAAVDECRTLGNSVIVCPYLDASVRKTADDYHRLAADFNKIAESVGRAGMRFAYHNHDFEFAKLPSGEMGYDILLKECDPKLVKMEMDLYWITKAGQDPLTYFAKYPGRYPLVHVKDMTGAGEITNVGQGKIDWSRIFAKRREAGIEHFFVENDNAKSMNDIKISYDYLAKLGL